MVTTICYIYAFTARNPITSNHFKDFTAAPRRQISERLTSILMSRLHSSSSFVQDCIYLNSSITQPSSISIAHRRSVTMCSKLLWQSRSTHMVKAGVSDTLAHYGQKHSFNRLLSNRQHGLHPVRDSWYQTLDFIPSRTSMGYDTLP